MSETVTRPEEADVPLLHEVDVVVVGGGPGGIGAAVAAARGGARALLCERYGFLGGMMTAGLVSPLMDSGLEGRPFDSGIMAEWRRLMDQMGGLGADGRTVCHETAKLAAEQLCLEAGVELLYHVQLDRPLIEGRRI
ncbi:MAG: FAD-dependent oxidoreductase, partial [Planctomycetota bacterium]